MWEKVEGWGAMVRGRMEGRHRGKAWGVKYGHRLPALRADHP
jgi:hypothetical protein